MWWLQGVLKVSVLVGAIVRAVQRLINSRLSSLNRYLCWLLRAPFDLQSSPSGRRKGTLTIESCITTPLWCVVSFLCLILVRKQGQGF